MEEYELVKTLGRGAFAVCSLAKHKTSGAHVVIKQYSVPMSELDERERRGAANEISVLKSLVHPNVIRYLHDFQHGDVLHIVMEYADQGTLHEAIQTARGTQFSEDRIWEWLVQLLDALEYVHSRRILHRDLKPHNVMLAGPERRVIKLGDFGISRVLNTQSMAATLVGTPYYLSPEQCEGSEYDARSDVWALGCVLYEMMNLHRPFEATSVPALVLAIVRGKRKPVTERYSAALRALLERMLEPEAEARATVAELCAHAEVQARREAWLRVRDRVMAEAQAGSSGATQARALVLSAKRHNNPQLFMFGEGQMRPVVKHESATAEHDIVQLAASLAYPDHCLAVTRQGLVLAWGCADEGRLGLGAGRSARAPRVVCALRDSGVKVTQVAAGQRHSLALAGDHRVYAWGCIPAAHAASLRLQPLHTAPHAGAAPTPSSPASALSSPCATAAVVDDPPAAAASPAAGSERRALPDWARQRAAALESEPPLASPIEAGRRANPYATGGSASAGSSPVASASEQRPFPAWARARPARADSNGASSAGGKQALNPSSHAARMASPVAAADATAVTTANTATATADAATATPTATATAATTATAASTATSTTAAPALPDTWPQWAKQRAMDLSSPPHGARHLSPPVNPFSTAALASGAALRVTPPPLEPPLPTSAAAACASPAHAPLRPTPRPPVALLATPPPAPSEPVRSAGAVMHRFSLWERAARGDGCAAAAAPGSEGSSDSGAGRDGEVKDSTAPAPGDAGAGTAAAATAVATAAATASALAGKAWKCLPAAGEWEGCVALPHLVASLLSLRVVRVACGADFSAVLSHDGEVYTWGDGADGKLGHGDEEDCPAPRRVEALVRAGVCVGELACGEEHALALARDGGVLLSWGCGADGRLGVGSDPQDDAPHLLPARVPLPASTRLVSVSAGRAHCAAATADGRVLAWGANDSGQLGTRRRRAVGRPVEVEGAGDVVVVAVACGEAHTLALTAEGAVLAWGCGEAGRLGLGSASDEEVPRLLNVRRAVAVEAGSQRSLCLCRPSEEVV